MSLKELECQIGGESVQVSLFDFFSVEGHENESTELDSRTTGSVPRGDVAGDGNGALAGASADEVGEAGEGGPAGGGRVAGGEGHAGGDAGAVAGEPRADGLDDGLGGGAGETDIDAAGDGGRGSGASGGRGVLGAGDGITAAGLQTRDGDSGALRRGFTQLGQIPLELGGKVGKFNDNVAAITTLRRLEQSGEEPTPDDLVCLSKYVGWGGLQEAFMREDGSVASGWNKRVAELTELLSDEELHSARLTTTDAHYTSREVVSAMWKYVVECGFTGGRVLEPACGIGNFLGLMPDHLHGKVAVDAVEIDDISARIARMLYPGAEIHRQGFEESEVWAPDEGQYDLVIMNPPFGQQKVYDRRYPEQSSHSIHNYFVLKSLEAVRPGGVVATVISRNFLDASTHNELRERIGEEAELVGAVRLPNTVFEANAGTSVTTDLVFLRKRDPELESVVGREGESRWFDVVSVDNAAYEADNEDEYYEEGEGDPYVDVNEYFRDRPEQMLGQWGTFGGTVFGDTEALVEDESRGHWTARLGPVLDSFPGGFMPVAGDLPVPLPELDESVGVRGHGEYFMANGAVYQRDLSVREGVTAVAVRGVREVGRYESFIAVRDQLTDLVAMELSDGDEVDMTRARDALRGAYRNHVRIYGHFNEAKNKRGLSDDPSWSKVVALETASARGGRKSYDEAEILRNRVLFHQVVPESVDTVEDALTLTLAVNGRVDLPYMENLYSGDAGDLLAQLSDRIFCVDPGDGSRAPAYATVEEYLSGDVRSKLAEAERFAETDPRFERNVEALSEVQPQDVMFSEITLSPGAHWIPEEMMRGFVSHLYGTHEDRVDVNYLTQLGRWDVNGIPSYESQLTWGTNRAKLKRILHAVFGQTTIAIYDKVGDDGARELNMQASAEANAKAALVREEFGRWISESQERQDELKKVYNEKFNREVDREFDGKHLTLTGKVGDNVIRLKEHQLDAVWRIVSSGSPVLLDHEVGAGKTYVMVAAAMEMRRLGLAKKPLFVVPNQLVAQWQSAFNELYPGAKVFAANENDTQANNRTKFFSRVALSDWDAVVVASSAFDRIRVSYDKEMAFLENQAREYTDAQERLKQEQGENASTVKEMARRIKSLEARMKRLADLRVKDTGFMFDELGVDAIFVDESQGYKNLFFTTMLSNVAGLGNPIGARKSLQMFLKTRDVLEKSGGRNLIFASGTPVSNTMAEIFTLKRYLDYDHLKSVGLVHFDAWCNMFGQVRSDYELKPTGEYKPVARLTKFFNLPELMKFYRRFADIQTAPMLEKAGADKGFVSDKPKIKGGRAQPVVAERSKIQGLWMDHLAERAGNLQKPDNMLAVVTDARKIALDARLVDGKSDDFAASKVYMAAEKIADLYKRTTSDKGTQLVFLDLSTPKAHKMAAQKLVADAKSGDREAQEKLDALTDEERSNLIGDSDFSVYDDLRTKLVELGVDSKDIEFVHSAKNKSQKAALFAKMNRGEVRVLLGSTGLLGAGVNVQKKLVGLHHLDCPWRPADVKQREGRIIRSGNELFKKDPENFEVEIYRYATKGTLDAWMWQTVEVKAKMIEEMRSVKEVGREIEEGINEGQVAAVMKAEASGDPRLLEGVQLLGEIEKMEFEKKGFVDEGRRVESLLDMARHNVSVLPEQVERLKSDVEVGAKCPVGEDFVITLDGVEYTDRDKAGRVLKSIREARQSAYFGIEDYGKRQHTKLEDNHEVIGSYGGFNVLLEASDVSAFGNINSMNMVLQRSDGEQARPFAYRCGSYVSLDASPVGLMSSLSQTATRAIKNKLDATQESLENAHGTVRALEVRQKDLKVWPKAEDLKVARERYSRIQSMLAELAEKQRAERLENADVNFNPDAAVGLGQKVKSGVKPVGEEDDVEFEMVKKVPAGPSAYEAQAVEGHGM